MKAAGGFRLKSTTRRQHQHATARSARTPTHPGSSEVSSKSAGSTSSKAVAPAHVRAFHLPAATHGRQRQGGWSTTKTSSTRHPDPISTASAVTVPRGVPCLPSPRSISEWTAGSRSSTAPFKHLHRYQAQSAYKIPLKETPRRSTSRRRQALTKQEYLEMFLIEAERWSLLIYKVERWYLLFYQVERWSRPQAIPSATSASTWQGSSAIP